MGGHQVPERGPNDDGYNEEGYDESQRAEILEATRDGPSDGIVLTDVEPDLGDDDDEAEDDLEMLSEELGEEDEEVDQESTEIEEDELQADFDEGDTPDEEDLDDRDRTALEP